MFKNGNGSERSMRRLPLETLADRSEMNSLPSLEPTRIQPDPTAIQQAYRRIQDNLLDLVEYTTHIGGGNVEFKDAETLRQVCVTHNLCGRDVIIEVGSGFSHIYTVRIMTGAHLERADRDFITQLSSQSSGRTKLGERAYKVDPPFSDFGKDVVTTRSGLRVFAGNDHRIHRVWRGEKKVYISLGEGGTENLSHEERAYFALQPWLQTEGLHSDNGRVVEHLWRLPHLVYDEMNRRIGALSEDNLQVVLKSPPKR
ncbi:hypothetical protein COV17_02945 [Candidatus Woesearchaeota archaeon CG10_big_fil_rev_8_21_14_0_10_36_11]|nr:MAG: hypothetical protein COV17_02945 [Candidatus Woesearchaeota archaeon CG10_big_fil_rev_8_21_14_0_10_36_11]